MKKIIILFCICSYALTGNAQTITTIAGNGTAGYSGDGGAATAAELQGPYSVARDGGGNIYVADYNNHRIRKVNSSGIISTFAGNGTPGYSGDGGPATAAEFYNPVAIAIDGAGNIYVADASYVSCIRKITTSGIISTIAGNGTSGYSGDGGAATAAEMDNPLDVAVDAGGNIYIADAINNVIRKVSTSGIITTIAGNGYGAGTGGGSFSGDGGAATAASLYQPDGVAIDATGNIYISDNNNDRIRKVTATGTILTIAGSSGIGFGGDGGAATLASLYHPEGLTVDISGNVYFADHNRIRKVNTSGIINTIAGTSTGGYTGDGGAATAAELLFPSDVAVDDSGNVYIADYNNFCIRKVSTSSCSLPTIASITGATTVSAGSTIILSDATSGGSWSSSSTSVATISSTGVLMGISAGTVSISYTVTNSCGFSVSTRNVTVSASTSTIITTIAGNGTSGFTGDGGAATAAELNNTFGVVVDGSGNVYFSDYSNQRVRKVNASGTISTIAGNGTSGYSGDGGAATVATLYNPRGLAIDGSGNVYIADANNNVIRRVTPSGVISTIAGGGSGGLGDGGAATAATLNQPGGLAIDAAGNLYIADQYNQRIRKVATSGLISTIAGNGTAGYSGDGGAATSAEINIPQGITVDASGNVYIADTYNSRIRKVSPTGVITTMAGNGTGGYSGDGGAATAAELYYPYGVLADASGNFYISDQLNQRIRLIAASGTISTIAGNGTAGYSGDGGAATAAKISYPQAIAIDAIGNIYISDGGNNRIRKVGSGSSCTTPSVATITGSTSVCPGGNITLTDGTTGGTWSTSSTAIATVSTSGVVTGVSSGSVSIYYMVTNSCGSATATKNITVTGPPASGSIVGSSATICTGSSVTLADGVSGGVWSSSASSVASVSTAGVITGITSGTATISYTVTNSCGLSNSAMRSVTVNNSVSAGTISGPSNICLSGSATLSTSGSSGGTWSSTNPSAATVSSSGVVTPVSVSATTIKYTVSSACMTSVASQYVTISSPSTAVSVTGPLAVCVGSSVTFACGLSGGSWSTSGSGVASVSSAGVVTGLSAGARTISYTITNACGTFSGARNITVSAAAPTVGVTGPSTVAVGNTIILTHSGAAGAWSSAMPSLATVNSSGVVTGVAVGTDSLRYTATNACGSTTVSKAISITAHRGAAIAADEQQDINVYPNPTNGVVQLSINGKFNEASITISDINGKVLISKTTNEQQTSLDLSDFATGVYLLNVKVGDNVYCRRVVVQ